MKKFLYLILPAVMLAAFLFTPGMGYLAAQKEIAARVAAREEAVRQTKAAEDAKRAEIQQRAEEDARARQRENEALERAKEEKKRKEYEDAVNKLKEETATYIRETEAFNKENAALEVELGKLRDRKESLNRENFDLAKQVELAKIERRTAELEIQRMVGMVSRTLSASPLLAPPPVATPPKR